MMRNVTLVKGGNIRKHWGANGMFMHNSPAVFHTAGLSATPLAACAFRPDHFEKSGDGGNQ